MGAKNYVIEGVSCAGKTTVCTALQQRGYHVVHGDRTLAYWGDPVTGKPLESEAYEHWIWDVDKVSALATDHRHPVTFFCGGSRNLNRFIELLDGVFVLEIDLATLNQRLASRPADEWGGSPSEGAAAARLQHAKKAYIPEHAILIDATKSVEQVVDAILMHVNQPA